MVVETQGLAPSSATFPGELTGSWVESGAGDPVDAPSSACVAEVSPSLPPPSALLPLPVLPLLALGSGGLLQALQAFTAGMNQ